MTKVFNNLELFYLLKNVMNEKRCYKTLVNLVHPAFLGAVIVNFFDQVISWPVPEKISVDDFIILFLGTLILIFYFWLDFLVALANGKTDYNRSTLLGDILVLISFYVAFRVGWETANVVHFFLASSIPFLIYIIRDFYRRRKDGKDPVIKFSSAYVKSMLLCASFPLVPVVAIKFKPSSFIFFSIEFISLLLMAIGVLIYAFSGFRK